MLSKPVKQKDWVYESKREINEDTETVSPLNSPSSLNTTQLQTIDKGTSVIKERNVEKKMKGLRRADMKVLMTADRRAHQAKMKLDEMESQSHFHTSNNLKDEVPRQKTTFPNDKTKTTSTSETSFHKDMYDVFKPGWNRGSNHYHQFSPLLFDRFHPSSSPPSNNYSTPTLFQVPFSHTERCENREVRLVQSDMNRNKQKPNVYFEDEDNKDNLELT